MPKQKQFVERGKEERKAGASLRALGLKFLKIEEMSIMKKQLTH